MRITATALACVMAMATAGSAARRAPSPDQSCVPVAPRSGVYGGTVSQSFRPKAATVGVVDVMLLSTRTQRVMPRLRLVGQRNLTSGLAAQTVVLATQQRFLTLPAWRVTWLRLRLPKVIPVAAAGPTADQLAVQIDLPAGDDSLFWVRCDGYVRGNGQANVDPGSAVNRDTGTAIVANLPHGLAFREFSTVP